MSISRDPKRASSLVKHAWRELELAGFISHKKSEEFDYNGEIAKCVIELMQTFSDQGHSGYSASVVIQLFNSLSKFKTLSPITNNPEEWMNIDGKDLYQSRRQCDIFSDDGLKTFYSIDDKNREKKPLLPPDLLKEVEE